jgi:hypothetical protein
MVYYDKTKEMQELKNKLYADSTLISTVLYELSKVGTPQSQQTDEYKHLRTAIEALGAQVAILNNNHRLIVRMEEPEE